MSTVTFEVSSIEDAELLADLRVEAMRESLERVGLFHPVKARERLLKHFAPEHTRHVVHDGVRVGFVVVRPNDHEILLDHLYIHPNHQNKGIGAEILKQIFKEADEQGLPVRVGALRESDSNRFYLKHGFVQVQETQYDIYYLRPLLKHIDP